MSLFKSQYYDKPDGEDYVGKMFATTRMMGAAALTVGIYDVVMYTHPKGYLPTISRFMWWLGPAVGMASAFTTGTYAATKLRGTDDKWNYVVGSCAAAGVLGAWQRNPVMGFSACLFFSIAGCVKKSSKQEGWDFFPQESIKKHVSSSVSSKKYDFTLTGEGEKGWTTGSQ